MVLKCGTTEGALSCPRFTRLHTRIHWTALSCPLQTTISHSNGQRSEFVFSSGGVLEDRRSSSTFDGNPIFTPGILLVSSTIIIINSGFGLCTFHGICFIFNRGNKNRSSNMFLTFLNNGFRNLPYHHRNYTDLTSHLSAELWTESGRCSYRSLASTRHEHC